jgi:hypothetical protein
MAFTVRNSMRFALLSTLTCGVAPSPPSARGLHGGNDTPPSWVSTEQRAEQTNNAVAQH